MNEPITNGGEMKWKRDMGIQNRLSTFRPYSNASSVFPLDRAAGLLHKYFKQRHCSGLSSISTKIAVLSAIYNYLSDRSSFSKDKESGMSIHDVAFGVKDPLPC